MLVVELSNQPCVLAKFGSDILFTNESKESVCIATQQRCFVGSNGEEVLTG